MNIKRLAAVILTAILLLSLSACGNSGADIPISRLEFGMSEEDVRSAIRVEPYDGDKYSDPAFPVYMGTIDIDDDLSDCMFVFGGDSDKLQEIFINGDYMPQEDCFALRDRLIKNFSGLYGVSESDWDIQNDGYQNFLNYKNENGQCIQLYIRLYDGEQEDSAWLMLILKSYDNIPVIPKNRKE